MSEHIPGIGRFGSDVVTEKFSDEEEKMASSVRLAPSSHSKPKESSLKKVLKVNCALYILHVQDSS